MLINEFFKSNPETIEYEVVHIIERLHHNGPCNQQDLEYLSYVKFFHQEIFLKYEKKLMFLLGLFYKTSEAEDVLSLFYSSIKEAIEEEMSNAFTPVQYSICKKVKENIIYSFSAPTSAGKSHALRKVLDGPEQNVVVVVPTRALLAEYLYVLRQYYSDRKDVLILDFVDDINRKHTTRRIFLLTPERLTELYKSRYTFNIELFVFDEAQISDELNRGVNFEYVVKKSESKYPQAKKVFIHPAIENPEAQLNKFNLHGQSNFYPQQTTGKIYLLKKKVKEENGDAVIDIKYLFFDPFEEKGHLQKKMHLIETNFFEDALKHNKNILFFVSKKSIVSSEIVREYGKYINLCPVIEDEDALKIINQIEYAINAQDSVRSNLINLLKRGIVIHHGSIPLNVRFLLEEFMKLGFSRICFSTSTLLQGVNMPFDVVAIDNFRFFGSEDEKSLGLKNLIGRAGRTSQKKNSFDYGFVVVSNAKDFISRLNRKSLLSNQSVLLQKTDSLDYVKKELIDSLNNDSFNQELVEPETRLQRIRSLFEKSKCVSIILESWNRELNASEQELYDNAWKNIYECYINRPLLEGELKVFNVGLRILKWEMEGKGFREILGRRYAYLIKKDPTQTLYSPVPGFLPNSKWIKPTPSPFLNMSKTSFNYDILVYDTYDYMDKVVELSILPVFIRTFELFYKEYKDERVEKVLNSLKYGSNDEIIILLKRYGFIKEEIDIIKDYVLSASEDEIAFRKDCLSLIGDELLRKKVERYMN